MKKSALILALTMLIVTQSTFAIEDNKKTKFSFKNIFKRSSKNTQNAQNTVQNSEFGVIKLPKIKKKASKVEEIKLPPVRQGKRPPISTLSAMTIEDCVEYALNHDPNIQVSKERVLAAKAGIGQQRANYAPRLTARVSYNHNTNHGNRMPTSHDNSIGFNVGISETIWDFGKTTARINMAKFDTMSAIYDHEFETLNVVYDVKIAYYRVLHALANLDIFEQNVRIQTLNYERTKAMFDEGLKSKIDVVNAEVNLTDAKIQLTEGRNTLETALISLKNAMYFEEDKDFIVQNTENFSFLKADYRKKIESITVVKPAVDTFKRTPDGLIMLTSGIEHNDIIQNFEFHPFTLSKQEAVDEALSLRPDLKANEMLTQVQEQSLKALKRQYLPDVTGDVSWGYTKNDDYHTSPFQIGASVGVGGLNPYKIHYDVKEGESYLNIAYHNLNIAKADIFWEVQQNYVNMRQLERKIPLMNTKVKATLENFELADGRYSVGLNNYVELQDALTNYNKSQLSFVQAVFEYNVARETLLKSMGAR